MGAGAGGIGPRGWLPRPGTDRALPAYARATLATVPTTLVCPCSHLQTRSRALPGYRSNVRHIGHRTYHPRRAGGWKHWPPGAAIQQPPTCAGSLNLSRSTHAISCAPPHRHEMQPRALLPTPPLGHGLVAACHLGMSCAPSPDTRFSRMPCADASVGFLPASETPQPSNHEP